MDIYGSRKSQKTKALLLQFNDTLPVRTKGPIFDYQFSILLVFRLKRYIPMFLRRIAVPLIGQHAECRD